MFVRGDVCMCSCGYGCVAICVRVLVRRGCGDVRSVRWSVCECVCREVRVCMSLICRGVFEYISVCEGVRGCTDVCVPVCRVVRVCIYMYV